MSELWADTGPASQGKILTAVLQGREDEAIRMLRGWSTGDLDSLDKAAVKLQVLIRHVMGWRPQ